MPTVVCRSKASYKKIPGLLELTDTHLQWTQDNKKAPSVRVAHSEAASLFCSKEGAPQVRMKLGLVGDEVGHNFTFTSPQAVALHEREAFKSQLTTIIARNRSAGLSVGAAVLDPSSSSSLSLRKFGPSASASLAPTPRPTSAMSSDARGRPSAAPSRAGSMPNDGGPSSSSLPSTVIAGTDAAADFRLRKTVLLARPELAAMHRELVMSGQITEAEFWEGRERLILAQAAVENQRKGRPGQLVDPRPQTTSEGGDPKIVITPQLVHDIFEGYPVVAKAYSDNVPSKLSEAEFWKRYFQSKLFNAHRASVRSSATQFVVKDDPIFDKYLEKDDDELEPRRQRNEAIDVLVNLGATIEDHGETGNEKDITMQAGRQKGVLPLIRKFNEHSERLLISALGDIHAAKRQRIDTSDGGDVAYSQIDLDDLHDPEASAGIPLEMQDRERYFDRTASRDSASGALSKKADVPTIIREVSDNLQHWDDELMKLQIGRKASEAALLAMTQNVSARLQVKAKNHDIPEGFFRQMTTCQTSANEFLRQFWSAICPPPPEAQTLSTSTPAHRAAKAAKMAGFLAKTHEKVDALVRVAQSEGVDPKKVEIAMKPVLDAVDRALTIYRQPQTSKRLR